MSFGRISFDIVLYQILVGPKGNMNLVMAGSVVDAEDEEEIHYFHTANGGL